MKFNIPKEIQVIVETLIKNKFQAYLVGGCVRDLLIGRAVNDWDIATDAKPEEIQKIAAGGTRRHRFRPHPRAGGKEARFSEAAERVWRGKRPGGGGRSQQGNASGRLYDEV